MPKESGQGRGNYLAKIGRKHLARPGHSHQLANNSKRKAHLHRGQNGRRRCPPAICTPAPESTCKRGFRHFWSLPHIFRANKEARMSQGPREYISFKDIGIDFCARTSSHGIPFVGCVIEKNHQNTLICPERTPFLDAPSGPP